MDIAQPEQVVQVFEHLGYPLYFGIFLGICKVLGAAVILAPKLPLQKEWAYAGIGIDFTAALVSHVAVDGVTGEAAPALVFLVVLWFSWHWRPAARRLTRSD